MIRKTLNLIGFFLPVVVFLLNVPATAGFLKIETRTSVQVAGDALKVQVKIVNNGSDSASNLQVHLKALNSQKDSPIKSQAGSGHVGFISL